MRTNQDNGGAMPLSMKYKICSIDAWAGDEKGSWDCNNWFSVGEIEIDLTKGHKEIIALLIEEGYLKPLAKRRVAIEEIGDYTIRIVDKKTFQPLYDLEAMEGF